MMQLCMLINYFILVRILHLKGKIHHHIRQRNKERNMPPVINQDLCIGCGTCADICPMNVFEQKAPKTVPSVAYGEECWHCNACVLDCPKKAVSLRIPLNYMLLHVDAAQFKE